MLTFPFFLDFLTMLFQNVSFFNHVHADWSQPSCFYNVLFNTVWWEQSKWRCFHPSVQISYHYTMNAAISRVDFEEKTLKWCYVIKWSQSHTAAREDPHEWTSGRLFSWMDYRRLEEEHIKYRCSREDYLDSFTLSRLLFLKAFPASLWRLRPDTHTHKRRVTHAL